jgi:hypothetical protein
MVIEKTYLTIIPTSPFGVKSAYLLQHVLPYYKKNNPGINRFFHDKTEAVLHFRPPFVCCNHLPSRYLI